MIRRSSTASRSLALLLALVHLLSPLAVAAPTSGFARGVVRASEKVEDMAGGWQFATPLIVAGTNLIQSTLGDDEHFDHEELTNRDFLMGLGTDFLAVGLTRMAVTALPLPPVARIAAITTAGFLGWEVGSGNLKEADWAKLGVEIAASTALQVGLPVLAAAAGLALGPIALTGLTIAGTLAAGALFDHFRDKWRKRKGDGGGRGGGDSGEPTSGSGNPGSGTSAGEDGPTTPAVIGGVSAADILEANSGSGGWQTQDSGEAPPDLGQDTPNFDGLANSW